MRIVAGHLVWDWWDDADSARDPGETVGLLFLGHTRKFQSLIPSDRREFLQQCFPSLLSQCAAVHDLKMDDIGKLAAAVISESDEFALDALFKEMRSQLAKDGLLDKWLAVPTEFNPHEPLTGQTRKPGSNRSPN